MGQRDQPDTPARAARAACTACTACASCAGTEAALQVDEVDLAVFVVVDDLDLSACAAGRLQQGDDVAGVL
nr:hypothetical protein [Micromonospora sp. DSM 115978]